MRSYDEYKAGLIIDKHDLDNELMQHPHTYNEVGERWSESLGERDRLKEELTAVDAEIYSEIAADNPKLADAKVRAEVNADKDHEAAFNDWLAARIQADKWQMLYESYKQRGGMIRQLAELYIANYYTRDTVRERPQSAPARRSRGGQN